MDGKIADNQIYYFWVGRGSWQGQFSFHIHDWQAFWSDRLGLKNRCLALCMVLVQKIAGPSAIFSTILAFPAWGPRGVATNEVCIKKFGVTLYLLREQYVLNPDGTMVFVHSRERFGPVPFLFRATKRHPARIHERGQSAT
jgi:hypothetical protein